MDRRHHSARLSILGELAARLRTGEPVSDAEVARLRWLAETVGEAATHPGETVGWREVIFGRKESGEEHEGKEELERRELERGASSPAPPCEAPVPPMQLAYPFPWHMQSKVSCAVRMIPHTDRDPVAVASITVLMSSCRPCILALVAHVYVTLASHACMCRHLEKSNWRKVTRFLCFQRLATTCSGSLTGIYYSSVP